VGENVAKTQEIDLMRICKHPSTLVGTFRRHPLSGLIRVVYKAMLFGSSFIRRLAKAESHLTCPNTDSDIDRNIQPDDLTERLLRSTTQ